MKIKKAFVVDDEKSIRITLSDDLKDLGYQVYEYDNPLIALMELSKINPDIVFSDIKMPELNGLEFLKEIKKINPEIYVIIMTGYGSVGSAVEAVKLGAYNYLSKPLNIDDIKIILKQIDEIKNIKDNFNTIVDQSVKSFDFSSIIGSSEEVEKILNAIKLVAKTDFTVLIQGETGTGKELITNVIHYNSNRKDKPLIKLSCAILSREIFESELFGHEKGAFTGAIKEKKGRFELADNGTIYLDDIDDIPLELQVKLLRVLEESEFERVGGETTNKINVRVIASTKKNLKELVAQGKFREDLYYRLNIFPIELKPLRDRKEDIRNLFNYFLQKLVLPDSISIKNEVFQLIENYSFPGNVRELKHLVERLVILSSQSSIISSELLPLEMKNFTLSNIDYNLNNISLDDYLNKIESDILVNTLKQTGGNKSKAAELLKIPYSTLRTKLEKYSII